MMSSRERSEQIGCAEQRNGIEAVALLPSMVDHLTWEFHRHTKFHNVPMKTFFVAVLRDVKHCCLMNGQHYVFVCQETMVQL